jgi:hypothetical protein
MTRAGPSRFLAASLVATETVAKKKVAEKKK